MDKYTKFILTLIAVGILGINFHLFKGDIVGEAFASSHQIHKITICDSKGYTCGLGSKDVKTFRIKNYW